MPLLGGVVDANQIHIQDNSAFKNNRGKILKRWQYDGSIDQARSICIMIHGVGDHIKAYEGLAQLMWDNSRILLLGYDQVGHGDSEGDRVDIPDFQHYVDDCLQFVDLVTNEFPDFRVFIMGHSMGGLVVAHAALRNPTLCDGVILYSAAVVANRKVFTPFKIVMAKMLASILPTIQVGRIPETQICRDPKEAKKLECDPLRWQGGMKARWGVKTLVAVEHLEKRMAEFSLPVLILHGEEDAVCHVDGAKLFHDRISSANKSLKLYPECFHRLHSEPDGYGSRFVKDVCDWIISRCDKMEG